MVSLVMVTSAVVANAPSLKEKRITVSPVGVSLRYRMPRITSRTKVLVALLLKLMVSTPLVLVNVPNVVEPPVCRFDPLTVKPDWLKLNTSDASGVKVEPTMRCTVKLEPFQLAASFWVSAIVRAVPPSKATVLPTPAQATESVLRLVMVGAVLALVIAILPPAVLAEYAVVVPLVLGSAFPLTLLVEAVPLVRSQAR